MFLSKLVSGFVLVLAIYFTTSSPSLAGRSRLNHLLQVSKLSPIIVYAAGCVSGIILVPLLAYMFDKAFRYLFRRGDETDHALYRLDHGKLNIEIPPKTMWMNLGYWKVSHILRLKIELD